MDDIILYPGVKLEDSHVETKETKSSSDDKKTRPIIGEYELIELGDSDSEVEVDFDAFVESMKREETNMQTDKIGPIFINLDELPETHNIQGSKQSSPNKKRLPPLCRLCAIPSENMIDLFGPLTLHKSIMKKINNCLPITVKESDSISKQVCRLCLEKLESCYRFHETVTQAEKQLFLLHEQTSDKILEETEVWQSSLQSNRQRKSIKNADVERKLIRSSDTHADNIQTNGLRNGDKDNRNRSFTFSFSHENKNAQPYTETRATTFQSKEEVYSDTPSSLKSEICGEGEIESDKGLSDLVNYSLNPRKSSKARLKSNRIPTVKSSRSLEKKCKKYSKTNDNSLSHHNAIKGPTSVGPSNGHKSIECQVCQQTFQTIEKLQTHVSVHVSYRSFPCGFCDKILVLQPSWRKHWTNHLARDIKSEDLKEKELCYESDTNIYAAYKSHIK